MAEEMQVEVQGPRVMIEQTRGERVITLDSLGWVSTKAEVSKIHGDPHRSRINRSLNRETWFYGRSTVEFSLSSGLVQRWADAGGNLRVSYGTRAKRYFRKLL